MKFAKALLMVMAVTLMVVGCGGKEEVKSVDRTNVPQGLAGAPEWVFQPESAGKLAAVGSARKSQGGLQFQRTAALASARDELARMMEVNVRNMFKTFQESTGIGDAETFDTVSTNVSKQVAKQTLVGSKQAELWMAPDGTLYVLVVLDPTNVGEAIKEQARTSLANKQAIYQKMEAQKAFADLDAEIEKALN